MKRLSTQWLPLLMCLVMVVSPVQSLLAAVAATPTQTRHHQSHMHAMNSQSDTGCHHAQETCPHCKHANCNKHCCHLGQCMSGLMAVLPAFSFDLETLNQGLVTSINQQPVLSQSTPPFRPPRA